MKIPVGFTELCQGLHQDAPMTAGIDQLAADCAGYVAPAHRPELREFLHQSLRVRTAAELKGDINSQNPDLQFSSAGAKAFLEAVCQHLDQARTTSASRG